MKPKIAPKLRNALRAIPKASQHFLSGNQIHNRQQTPRMSRGDLYPLLEVLARRKEIDRLEIGHMLYYRAKAAQHLAKHSATSYNDPQRNTFSLDANVDWLLQTLHPIRKDKVVHLWMDLPQKPGRKTSKDTSRRLVIVCPGPIIGFPSEVVMVSVVGLGSSLIRPLRGEGIANLVLAGMPARLAKLLMNTLHRVLKE